MEKNKVNWKKLKLLILIPLLVIATIVYIAYTGSSSDLSISAGEGEAELAGTDGEGEDGDIAGDADVLSSAGIYVDVGGAVAAPGVVSVSEGARVFEVIEKAGGLTQKADTKNINLAALCEDGQKIYIPEEGEASAQGSTGASGGSGSTYASSYTTSTDGKVNINTASQSELETLSGVGPSTAAKIIDYRTKNGSFKSVDDLTNVSGIGDKTLAKLRDDICV